jgi:predicted regulator of Ras-like GTPase activity (Roadblock/LC7/MglB family)
MANAAVLSETRFREVISQLRTNVAGTKAIVLIGPDGVILEHLTIDPAFDMEAFTSEYAMLLRIAHRTSEDTGSGSLTEHIAISERTMTIARCFASEFYLILVSNIQDQIGRARYELKRAAFYLERTMHVRTR